MIISAVAYSNFWFCFQNFLKVGIKLIAQFCRIFYDILRFGNM